MTDILKQAARFGINDKQIEAEHYIANGGNFHAMIMNRIKDKKITMKALCEKSGYSFNTISRWATGIRPSLVIAVDVLEALEELETQ